MEESRSRVPSFLYTGYYLFLAMVYLALGPSPPPPVKPHAPVLGGAMLANVAGLLSGSAMGGMGRLFGPQTSALAVLGVTYALFTLGSCYSATVPTACFA